MSTPIKYSNNVVITHKGVWKIADNIEIECYVTKDARRLMSLRGTARAMNLKGGGSTGALRNLRAKFIQPFLSDQLKNWILRASQNKIEKIKADSGPTIIPFDAELFSDVCKAYVNAHIAGVLNTSQQVVSIRLLGVMTAFTKVGVTAVIDEITGYQINRRKDELLELSKRYVAEELCGWVKTFPDEFFEQLFRLKGWGSFKDSNRKIPQVAGRYIRDIVYRRLPEDVLDALYKKTPKSKAGNKVARLHQSLTEDVGRKHLEKLIIAIIALMKGADSWEHFMYLVDKSYPIKNKQMIMWELLY